MTRDFAKKNRPPARRNRPSSQVPGWVWLFTGLVLGGFIVFLVSLSDVELPDRPDDQSQPQAKAEPEPEEKAIPKPRFDFYKLLRESEVIVPATESSGSSGPDRDQQAQESSPDEFILQVGSFRRSQEADSLRAQLLLLNLDAYTEKVTLRNDEVWHRVLVGPFSNQSRLASARSTLVSNQYNALVLKRKKE